MSKIFLKNVRLAFPNLFTATAVAEGKPTYGASFIMERKDPNVAKIEEAMEVIAKAKWGAKASMVLKGMKAGQKLCLRDGDLKAQYEGFEGNMYVSANAQESKRPTVLNKDKSALIESDGVVYSGCYVNASLELWAMDNQYGQRINANLLGVQFADDGDSFGGGGAVADPDDFEDLSVGEEAGDLT